MSLKRGVGMVAAAAILASPSAAANGNGRIVYSDGSKLYAVESGGGAPMPLRAGFNPAFSPDGARLAFEQWTGDGFEVDVAAADGSNPVRVAAVPAAARLIWSPDGTRIGFVSGTYVSGFALTVANADGSGSTTASQDASGNAPPTWSPDGTELAFATANDIDIAVVNATGGGRRLLIQDSTNDTAPSWSPDGSQIAFFRGGYGTYRL
jgi:Tol biopolymer transport system component